MDKEYDDPTKGQTDEHLPRRSYLQLVGTAVASVATVASYSDTVQAESSGYGEGRYGEVAYGGTSDLSVVSLEATDVTDTSVTLNGSVNDLGGADVVDCYFKWRRTDASNWNTTANQSLTSTGSFSTTFDGLSDSTDYEYQAVAEASGGDSDLGTTTQFATTSSDAAPVIDSYSVTEAGSRNPHCEITADWSVSDADGDLDNVIVKVADDAGSFVDFSLIYVDGSSASGSTDFKIKKVDGQTFDVKLTVVDSQSNSTSQTRTVTE